MQLSLWSSDPDPCQYPHLAVSSAYRYGCRCARCIDAKRARHPSIRCGEPGCKHPRLKYRRWCETHAAQKAKPSPVRSTAECIRCGRSFNWYESEVMRGRRLEIADWYRQVCGTCRRPYISQVRTHHLDTAHALRLIFLTNCEFCAKPLSRGQHGGYIVHVDHNHGHCRGPTSCGAPGCVRGFMCPTCNTRAGAIEQLLRDGCDLEAMLKWIGPLL